MSDYENMDIMLGSSRLGELNEDLDSFAGRSSQRDRENSNGMAGNSSLESEIRICLPLVIPTSKIRF